MVFVIFSFEKEYMEEVKQRAEEAKEDKSKQTPVVKAEEPESGLQSKTSSSSAEQDLDTFLLGDFEDSDGGGGIFTKIHALIAEL